MLRYLLLVMLCIISSSASAVMSISYYQQYKNMFEVKTAVNEVGDAYGWVNVELIAGGQRELFCPPYNLALEASNYISILETELKTGRYKSEDSINLVLLHGLERTFPCKK